MILVAGGTGRLGTLLVSRLAARGEAVRVLTRQPEQARGRFPSMVDVVAGDVRDPAAVAAAVAGASTVVSAVQGLTGTRGSSPASVDRDGNYHLTDAARAVGAEMVLVSVVGAAADSPMELFRMKHAAETYLAASGVPATIVRASAFLELWIELLRSTAGRSGRPLVFGGGRNPINFVSVLDVAALIDDVIAEPATRGQTIQIAGPEHFSFDQLAERIATASGSTATPRHVPPGGLRVMAATVGRVRPALGRQARAALVMDRLDLTFRTKDDRGRFPGVPCNTLREILQ